MPPADPSTLRRPRWTLLGCAALLPASYWLDATLAGETGGVLRLLFSLTVPGLCLQWMGWRVLADTPTASLLRAFALSPLVLGASSLGLALALDLRPGACAALVAPLLATVAVGLAWLGPLPVAARAATRPVRALPLAVLAAAAGAVLVHEGARTLGGAPEQAALIARLWASGLPAEDPGLAGHAPAQPWVFAWMLAVLAGVSGLSAMKAGAVVSGLSLLAWAGLGGRTALDPVLGRGGGRLRALAVAASVLAIPFAADWAGPLLLATGTGRLDAIPAAIIDPRHGLLAITGPGDARGVTLLARCLEVGPVALALANGALWLDAVLGHRRGGAWTALLAGLTVSCLSPWAGLALVLTLAPALPRSRWQLLATAAALAATWPLAEPLLRAAADSPDLGRSGLIRHHALGLLWNAPFVLLAVCLTPLFALRWRTRVLAFAVLVPTLMSVGLALEDRAESRLAFLASLPAGMLLLHLGGLLARRAPRLAAGLGAGVLCLALASHGITLRALLGSRQVWSSPWSEEGSFLVRQGRSDRTAAYRWLRDHSAPGSVVLESPRPGRGSEVAAATGRASFLARARLPADPSPARRRRRPLLEGLTGGVAAAEPLIRRIVAEIPGREIYLLREEPGPKVLAKPRAAPVPDGMETVLRRGHVRLLRLQAPQAAAEP